MANIPPERANPISESIMYSAGSIVIKINILKFWRRFENGVIKVQIAKSTSGIDETRFPARMSEKEFKALVILRIFLDS